MRRDRPPSWAPQRGECWGRLWAWGPGAQPLILLQEFLDAVGDVLLRLLELLLQLLALGIQGALVLAQALLQPGLLLQQDGGRS